MADLERIRFLSANYASLQGLRRVPIGLIPVLMALWGYGLGKPTTDTLTPFALIIIGCMALYLAADRYYARVFGHIQRTTGDTLLDGLIGVGGWLLALAAVNVDRLQILPVSTLGLVCAAFLLATYLRITRLAHCRLVFWYPVMAILMIGLSLAPLFGAWDAWLAIGIDSPVTVTWFFFGLVLIVEGVLSHWFLIRSLPPMREADNG